ncbi:MAG: enoyl-CoA hydratase/isomerase family protein [Betaproteobacteria bacterium]|nr:enoyl-CoA hydratase/isomerase family protein [Betaproteobacteria bacterium]NCX88339.1 enoyl-CoA hydratase/isomerase family protein [Betaproteobacteria bacterium]NDG19400.1 enoyl-CoA hydratase/isomerase family protein [Betaproteobacteria bacterium]
MTQDFELLEVNIEASIAEVIMKRRDRRNALSQALMREMIRCARDLSEQLSVQVVVLRGDGDFFSAGADLREAQAWAQTDRPLLERREMASLGFRMCQAWEAMPQIVIAAIEGYAVGGGLAIALACDWRVMARNAFLSLPEIALGIPLTWGTIPRLHALVGPAKAKRLTILCERIPAPQAQEFGLVDWVSDEGQARGLAFSIALQVLQKPASAVRMSKESIQALATMMHHAAGYMAHDQIALAAASEESMSARAHALRK